MAAAVLACDGQPHANTIDRDARDGGTALDSAIDAEPTDADAASDSADAGDEATDDSDVQPHCRYGYHPFGTCCDDLIFEIVDGERVPVAENAIFERFEGCPCDPALPVASGWWCADALIEHAILCGNRDLPRRWIAGSVEPSDFDGPPLECTWELLASHTGEYPDQGL